MPFGNLDPADDDPPTDVYLKDLLTGDISVVDTTAEGKKAGKACLYPVISADGTAVAFSTEAKNLDPRDTDERQDIYVKDLVTGDLLLASTSDEGIKGNFDSGYEPVLSATGDLVVFDSYARNLDPNDADDYSDVFAKDLRTGDITLVSTTDQGVNVNGHAWEPSVPMHGSWVVFIAASSKLDPKDLDLFADIYAKDLRTGDLRLLSVSDSGAKGNAASNSGEAAPTGWAVAFISQATNLDPSDPEPGWDVYVKTLAPRP